MTAKISIIIPAYNASESITASIESVLAQSHKNFELILIDDKSTDNTLEVIKSYDDPRITILEHPENKGAAAARNTGIQSAKGDIIAFLDSDDIWMPEKLEQQIPSITDETPASCTSFTMIRGNDKRVTRRLSKTTDLAQELLTVCSTGPGSTMMAKRELFFDPDIGLFPEHYKRLEDWNWLLKYSYKHKLGITEEPLTEIRMSGFPSYQAVAESCDILFEDHKDMISKTYGPQKLNYFRASMQVEKAHMAYRWGMIVQTISHSFNALIISPSRFCRAITRIITKIIKEGKWRTDRDSNPGRA